MALLRVCLDEERPIPGLVLIDSPLVVYSEPDPGEELPADVKDQFYRSVSEAFTDAQVIMLENDSPPDDVASTANVIAFTASGTGRRGFIPA